MPRNRKTLGSQAELARKKGNRRLERLEAVIANENVPSRIRNWATKQKKEIKSAMQGTRQYSKEGKRYKSKSKSYIQSQIDRLTAAVEQVAPRYSVTGNSFEITQRELNRASVKKPSVYTETEAKVFYRVTQPIWQQEGVGEHARNQKILDFFNMPRERKKLRPLELYEIVDYVLSANKFAGKIDEIDPTESFTPEQQAFYDALAQADNADGQAGSPPGVTQIIVDAIQDAMASLLTLPNPLTLS